MEVEIKELNFHLAMNLVELKKELTLELLSYAIFFVSAQFSLLHVHSEVKARLISEINIFYHKKSIMRTVKNVRHIKSLSELHNENEIIIFI